MADCSSDKGPQPAQRVLGFFPLLKEILQHLSYPNLIKCMSVSKLWSEVAEEVKQMVKRNPVKIDLILNKEIPALAEEIQNSKHPTHLVIVPSGEKKVNAEPLFSAGHPTLLTCQYFQMEASIAISSLNKSKQYEPSLGEPASKYPTGVTYGEPHALSFSCSSDGMKITPFKDCKEVNPHLEDPNLKAIILFNPPSTDKCNNTIEKWVEKSGHRIAIGGAKCDAFHNSSAKPRQKLQGLMISGEKVRAASIVLEQTEYADQQTMPDIQRKLVRLRKTNIGHGTTDSIAFTFPCVSRYWLDEDSLDPMRNLLTKFEFEPFRELFPDTPIFGFLGTQFECGYDSDLPDLAIHRRSEQGYVVGGSNVIVIVDSG